MEMVSLLRRLLAHDEWANREALASIRRAGDPPRARRLISHIVAAEALWLSRLQQDGKKLPVWPELTLNDCEAELKRLCNAWHEYLADLERVSSDGERASGAVIDYVNTKGEKWQNTVLDVLLHLPLHSSYHRGQIAIVLRDGGAEPAYTDYIECVRRGLLPLK